VPDGYTLLNASVQHVMLKPLLANLAFNPDADFVPVATDLGNGVDSDRSDCIAFRLRRPSSSQRQNPNRAS
jgi:hypothetical protein